MRSVFLAVTAGLVLAAASAANAAIGAPVVVGGAGAGSSSAPEDLVVTTGSVIPAGELVVAWAGSHNANGAVAITDSAGNTWTSEAQITAGTGRLRAFWTIVANPIPAGGTITVDYASTSGNRTLNVVRASGVDPVSPRDMYGVGAVGSSSTPTISTAALAMADELVISAIMVASGQADTYNPSAADPFVELLVPTASSGTGSAILRVDYRLAATAAPTAIAPQLGTSRNWVLNYIAFRPAAGGGPPPVVGTRRSLTGAGR